MIFSQKDLVFSLGQGLSSIIDPPARQLLQFLVRNHCELGGIPHACSSKSAGLDLSLARMTVQDILSVDILF